MSIYFWHTKKVVKQIKSGGLTQKDQMHYALAWVILGTLLLYLAMFEVGEIPIWIIIIEAILVLALSIIWVLKPFSANQRYDDRDFVGRLFAVSFPITIKSFALFFALGLLYGIVLEILYPDWFDLVSDSSSTAFIVDSIVWSGLTVLAGALVTWRTIVHFKTLIQ